MAIAVESTRDLADSDIAMLASAPAAPVRPLQQLRDRHHMLARLIAGGATNVQAAAVTGYNVNRVGNLQDDPTFRKLVADYRVQENELFAEFTTRATTLSLSAMNEIQDRLDDTPEEIGTGMLLEIGKFAADRTGHAPVTRNLNVNVNADLGDKLAAARRRLAEMAVE